MSQEFAIWVILSAGAVVEEVRKRRRVFVLIFYLLCARFEVESDATSHYGYTLEFFGLVGYAHIFAFSGQGERSRSPACQHNISEHQPLFLL